MYVRLYLLKSQHPKFFLIEMRPVRHFHNERYLLSGSISRKIPNSQTNQKRLAAETERKRQRKRGRERGLSIAATMRAASFIFALFTHILFAFSLRFVCAAISSLPFLLLLLPCLSHISFLNCSWTMTEIIAALPSFVSRRCCRIVSSLFSLFLPLLFFVLCFVAVPLPLQHFEKLHKFFYIWTFSLG